MNADPYNLPLTAQQRARLERAKDKGELNGVGSMHHLLRNEMGAAAPNKNQISTFMRALPSVQINKTTKSVAGTKNVIGPMIPPPNPPRLVRKRLCFHTGVLQSYRQETIFRGMCVHMRIDQVHLCARMHSEFRRSAAIHPDKGRVKRVHPAC
jgi:hypothetical protein